MGLHKLNPNHSGDTFNGRKQTKKDSDCTYGQIQTNNISTSIGDDMNDDDNSVADDDTDTDTEGD